MTKELLKAKIQDIFTMSEHDLIEFNQELNLSLIDAKSKMYIQTAIDDRLLSIRNSEEMKNADVVNGELKAGEI